MLVQLSRQFSKAASTIAVFVVAGCGAEGSSVGSVTGEPICDAVSARVDRELPQRVVGVGRSGGGCGGALVALTGGWMAVAADGTTCAAGHWPAGFVAHRARTLAGAGLLVTDAAGQNVRRLQLQADEAWLSVEQSASATEIVDADESPCGQRYLIVATAAGTKLRRLTPDGGAMWQQAGELTSVAAACDGAFVGGQTSSPAELEHDTVRQGWLRRQSDAGLELWRKTYPSVQDLRIVDLHLVGDGVGAHVVEWNLAHYQMQQRLEVLSGDGAVLVERAMPGRVIGGIGHPYEASFAPQEWPPGVVGWLMHSGYDHPGGTCYASTRVEAVRADGSLALVRELRQGLGAGWAALGDGSVLVGGNSLCGDVQGGWLMLLPQCR